MCLAAATLMCVRHALVQNEVKLLLDLLPRYYEHVEKHPHTLLIKFYGLHRVVPLNGSKVSEGAHMLHIGAALHAPARGQMA